MTLRCAWVMVAAERQVRDGSATLGQCALLPSMAAERRAFPFTQATMLPGGAPSHPLARETRTIGRGRLGDHIQLILHDPLRRPGPSFSVVSTRVWRFVDKARRLTFLLAGFG